MRQRRCGGTWSWGAYFGRTKPWINTTKRKSSNDKPANIRKRKQGNAKWFRRKRGKIDTHSAEGEKLLGENSCEPYRNNTVRLETHTPSRGILVWVCSHTNASASPPHSESFPSGAQWTKSSVKSFISPRGQQNTTLTHTQKQRKLSGASSTTDATFFVIAIVVVVHARKGRSFPSSESSQRSINNKHLLVGRSKFYWFFRCHWNRQIAHIHTFTHTYTHKYRETNLKRMHRSNFRSILR